MDQLQGNVLSHVLSYLPWKAVVECRRVSNQWKSAAAVSPVKSSSIDTIVWLSLREYFRNIQSLTFSLPAPSPLDDESFAQSRTFRQLRRLACCDTPNLEYAVRQTILPFFRNLTELNVSHDIHLEWKLRDLQQLPHLAVLRAVNNQQLTGCLNELQPHQLVVLELSWCPLVTGNLRDVARFPHLRELSLNHTAVVGDMREIEPDDFPVLQEIGLGGTSRVYGAGFDIQRVSHAHAVMQGRYYMTKRSTAACPLTPFQLRLDPESEDFYIGRPQQRLYSSELDPPFCLETVVAGNRRGYRWSNLLGGCCDIVWFDREPIIGEPDYEVYRSDLDEMMRSTSSIFKGFSDPPSLRKYKEASAIYNLLSSSKS